MEPFTTGKRIEVVDLPEDPTVFCVETGIRAQSHDKLNHDLWTPTKVHNKISNEDLVLPEVRKSYTCSTSFRFENLQSQLLDNEYITGFTLLKYPVGGMFQWHTDMEKGELNTATCILHPPNQDYDGGELELELVGKIPVSSTSWTLIILPIGVRHCVHPVTRGERYIYKTDLFLHNAPMWKDWKNLVYDNYLTKEFLIIGKHHMDLSWKGRASGLVPMIGCLDFSESPCTVPPLLQEDDPTGEREPYKKCTVPRHCRKKQKYNFVVPETISIYNKEITKRNVKELIREQQDKAFFESKKSGYYDETLGRYYIYTEEDFQRFDDMYDDGN